jgi:hypothetical protein
MARVLKRFDVEGYHYLRLDAVDKLTVALRVFAIDRTCTSGTVEAVKGGPFGRR